MLYPDLKPDADGVIEQPLDWYTAENARVWHTLFNQQQLMMQSVGTHQWLQGLKALPFDAHSIPNIKQINETLQNMSDFKLVAVQGLISSEIFFKHLSRRQFPVGWFVRDASQLDYLEEPDLFHDLFGHVPMLVHPHFANFMQKVGHIGLNIISTYKEPKTREIMANTLLRLYWFTVEFGLQEEQGNLKAYGAGIASSRGEIKHCFSGEPKHIWLNDVQRVARTKYRIDQVQPFYFVLNENQFLDELFSAPSLLNDLFLARQQGLFERGMILTEVDILRAL